MRGMEIPLTRRAALGALSSAPALALAGAERPIGPRPKRLLVLGGTRFLGPPIVRTALAAGWEVTLFNRGRSAPELFPDLELRKGDRNELDYASLSEGSWDAVIDTSAYVPAHVGAVARLLQGRVGSYCLVSTLSVYDEGAAREDAPIDEGAPVLEPTEAMLRDTKRIQDVTGASYGPLKAACEGEVRAVFGDQSLVVRPGLIVGPEDGSDRFTYWPARIARGGEVLAPGPGTQGVQFIDVRDLGQWIFEAVAAERTGTLNAVGFPTELTFAELLHGCKVVLGAEATFTWVDEEFLQAQEVGPWMELPLWIPGGGRTFALDRAIAAGLTFRPVGDTIRDTQAWQLESRDAERPWRAGLDPEKEARVLAAWHAR